MGRLILLHIIILIGIFSCSGNLNDKSLYLIQEIKAEYAPDSRTAIFNITIDGSRPIILQGETNLEVAKQKLLSSLKNENINFIDNILVLPDANVGDQKFALINVSVANLRGQAKHSAELVTQALLGTPVLVLKEANDWYLVQTPDKYIAWTNSGSLVRIDKAQLTSWKNSQKIIYLSTYGSSINPDGVGRISDLVSGNVLELKEVHENTWSVIYPDGRKAIIPKMEAMELEAWNNGNFISEKSITDAAKQMIGIPYLWGGTSTKGLDCSGFTKTVYLLHGLVIPRDASQQVNEGILIDTVRDFSKLEIGDLLFFGRLIDDQKEKVVHVGLWIGNNKFMHASGDVHISSMDSLDKNYDDYNYNRYLRTKRIIGANTTSINNLISFYQ